MTTFDAIVIGAGQAGPSLAGRLTGAGMTVALVERKLFGGTCVNTGCTPTKTLVASAHAAHLARRAAEYGVMLGGDVADRHGPREGARRRRLRGVAHRRRGLAARHAGLHRDRRARAIRGCPDPFASATTVYGLAHLHQRRRPRRTCRTCPASPRCRTSPTRPSSDSSEVPRHLVVVGGSYIGLEFAQMYRRFGAEVTVVEKGPRLIGREDEDVSEAMRDDPRGRGHHGAHGRRVHQSRRRRRWRRRAHGLSPGTTGRRRIARAARRRTPAQHRRPRPGARRRRHRRTRLHHRRRPAGHQRARHLGARRLQRPRRLHPHRLQRLRDRRGQPARRRDPPGQRPHSGLCAVHRSAARPRRHDRAGRARAPAARCWSASAR